MLRAALSDAVEEGLLRRSPAARVAMPRAVAKESRREVYAWSSDQVAGFLQATTEHRWSAAFRLAVLYGLRRSELLALKWDDFNAKKAELRIDEGVVAISGGGHVVWTATKNARSRRVIPLDSETTTALTRRRRELAAERLVAGPDWIDQDLIFTSRIGTAIMPRSFDRTLQRLVETAGLPRLTSHGLRHTAATRMVQGSTDLGELRAVADVLGHSPEMLLRVYAHAVPQSMRAVADRVGRGASSPTGR